MSSFMLFLICASYCTLSILGHTNASFTLDTYTHVTPDMQKAASGIVGGFMEDLMGAVQLYDRRG